MHRKVLSLLFLAVLATTQVYGQNEQGSDKSTDSNSEPTFRELAIGAVNNFQRGDYAKAEELASAGLLRQPQNQRLHMMLADIRFISGNISGAIDSYDKVISLQPQSKPYLWQRGLALYYAEKFKEGKSQFETHQTVNSQDVENAVWHLLCASKVDDLESARKKLIPIEGDTRVPMKEIYELFAGRMKPAQVIEVAESEQQNQLPLYYAHLYIGLYHEMLGQKDESKSSIDLAVKQSPDAKNNLMLQLARVHQQLRSPATRKESSEDEAAAKAKDDQENDK